jgi:hypothetical protein
VKAGSGRVGELMAQGMDYESARDESRLISMRNYQKRRYREDPRFRQRVLKLQREYDDDKRNNRK